MATSSDVKITQGAGTFVATYDITEDAETKKIQRISVNDSGGADAFGTVGSPGAGTLLKLQTDALAALNDATPALVVGATAADAALTVAPVTTGGAGSAAIPAAMSTDGDVTNDWLDLYGRQIVAGSPRARVGKQTTTITTSTAETTIVTAGAANVFRDLYRLTMTNTSVTATVVTIRDATGGSTVDVYALAAGETKGFSGPVDSADVQATAANNWTAQSSASITSLIICARYVERKV